MRHAWLSALSHTLLPHHCPLCENATESGLCAACAASLVPLRDACEQCAEPLATTEIAGTLLCAHCLDAPPCFDSTYCHYRYDTNLAFLIQRFKDKGQLGVGRWLCRAMAEQLQVRALGVEAMLPVPDHWRSRCQRGFNQAEFIAKSLQQRLNLPLWAGVRKRRQGSKQKTLSRALRRAEIQGQFVLTQRPPRSVAIVDDVVTTGATASTLAELLREAGCEHIEVWALARTPHPKHVSAFFTQNSEGYSVQE